MGVNGLYISGRERNILKELLLSQVDVTVKELADLLEVSERTIHRDLKKIEDTLAEYHLTLHKKAGIGLRIQGEREEREQLFSVVMEESVTDFTPEERKAILLSTLIETNEPIKLFTLANELQVTSATVRNDLDQLEREISIFDLSVVRKKGAGIAIEGNEAKKRAAISNLITRYLYPNKLSKIKESIQKKSKQPIFNLISDRLNGLVNEKMLEIIEGRVELARSEIPYELADSGYIGLVVHLALAMERLKKGDAIQFDQEHLNKIIGSKEYEVAKKIIKELEVSLSIDIPDDEIGYITMHLMGAKLRTNDHYFAEDDYFDITYRAKKMIEYVSEQLNEDLTSNEKLLHDLSIHLKPAIFRLKQGMTIINPMIKEIKQDYDEFYQIVQEGVRETFPDMDFPDDEVGYIVLHFAATMLQMEKKSNLKAVVICSSGIGTSKILATKLMQKIPEITMVENKSVFDVKEGTMTDYDILISTIPLEGLDGKYVLTSPMLTDTETKRIHKEIRREQLTPKKNRGQKKEEVSLDSIIQLELVQKYTNTILCFLKHFYIRKIEKLPSIQACLESICMEHEKSKTIENKNSIVSKLLQREQIGGVGIPDTQLALYHTRSSEVIIPSFTIHALSTPLTVQGMGPENMVIRRILLLLAPEKVDSEELEVFSYLSSLIIQGQESITLFESGSEQQLKSYLSDKFYGFIKKKI